MIDQNKDGIGSRFFREPGIGYARTHGNSQVDCGIAWEMYRERSGQCGRVEGIHVAVVSASPFLGG